jgi:glycosyltransferase involved in cell wall biosynthesis
MKALYVCYQSVREPLTHTQVVAYLRGLAKVGHQILLLTFEPEAIAHKAEASIRQDLRRLGIEWRWLRYHKRPTLPATAFDALTGVLYGIALIRAHRIQLVHARSHVPGAIALALRYFTGVRFLFDVRGLMAEEYVDARVWRANGLLFSLTKKAERRIMRAADSVVILTQRGRHVLEDWYGRELASKPFSVIPCCAEPERSSHEVPNPPQSPVTLAYVGKLGGCYATREMMRFVSLAQEVIGDLRFNLWTQSDPRRAAAEAAHAQIAENTVIGRLSPQDVVAHLSRTCHAALCMIEPKFSKLASSPTKFSEYLAAGLPVIVNAGIGDLDEIVRGEGIGVVVPEFSDAAYRDSARQLKSLLEDETLRARCLAAARKYFDLERIGWVRYRAIYDQMARP